MDVTAAASDVTLSSLDLESTGYGDSSNIDNIAIYKNGIKVSRERNVVDSKVTLDFYPALVVKAGETMKFVVSAKIALASDTGDSYGLRLVGVNSSAKNVAGAPLASNLLKSMTASNLGKLDFTNNAASTTSDIKVGEDKVLGSFKLALSNDKEDVKVESVKVKFDGTAKVSSLSNLRLLKDGVEVSKNPTISGNYINFVLDNAVFPYNISKTSTFDIKGTVSSDVGYKVKLVIEKTSDLFAYGTKFGFTTAINGLSDDTVISRGGDITIKGSKIDVSFTEGSKDSVKKDTKGFDFGSLKLKSNGGNYTMETYQVKVTYNTSGAAKELKNVKLGGVSYDSASLFNGATNSAQVFTFKDIVLPKDVEKSLAITADIDRTAANGDAYTVDASFANDSFKLKDEDNNKTYTQLAEVSDILSTTTGLDSKKVNVEIASLSQIRTIANSFNAVVGSTVTGYKGELKAGTAGDVRVTKVVFEKDAAHNAGNLNDILADAKLVIGDATYNYSSLDAGSVTFDGLNAIIAAGSENKKAMELSITIKDSSSISGIIALNVDSVVAEDNSDGSDVNVTPDIKPYANITVNSKGILTVEIDTSKDQTNLTDIPKFVRAGDTNVVLAKLKLKAQQEDVKVIDAYLANPTDLRSTFTNIRLVLPNGEVTGTISDDGKYIEFKGMDAAKATFKKDEITYALVKADVKASSQNQNDTAVSSDYAEIKFLHAIATPWKVE